MKALLPVWLVVVLAIAATLAGTGAIEAGAPWWVGVALAWLLGPGVVMALRRALPRRGRKGYDELPALDADRRSFLHGLLAHMINGLAPLALGALAGVPAFVAGLGTAEDGLVAVFPWWFVLGVLSAWPVSTELRARYALHIDRKVAEEEEGLRERVAQAERSTSTADADVPIDRRFGWGMAVGCAAGACSVAALGLFGSDVGAVERVFLFVGAPCMLFAAWRWALMAAAPYALRVGPEGLGVLGLGTVPWDAVAAAEVRRVGGIRHLSIGLEERIGDASWATPGLHRHAKRAQGWEILLVLRLCDWPAEQVLATLKAHGVREVDVALT